MWQYVLHLQEREYLEAKERIEQSESRLTEKDEEMVNMQAQLAEAREQAARDQEALLQAMQQMHVKDDESEQDQEHGGMSILCCHHFENTVFHTATVSHAVKICTISVLDTVTVFCTK